MKKIIYLLSSALCGLVIASCGDGQKAVEKMIPAANVEIFGPDESAITVCGDVKVFMVQDSHRDGYWSVRALVPITNNTCSNEIHQIYSFTCDLLDDNMSLINDKYGLTIQNSDAATTLLTSPAGREKKLVFEPTYEGISYIEYKNAVNVVKGTENISITLKINNPNYQNTSYSSSNEKDAIENYTGTVAGAKIHMSIISKNNQVTGRYYYDKQRDKGNMASMKLVGTKNGSTLTLKEFETAEFTGQFSGSLTDNSYTGTFTRLRDGKEFSFSLTKVDVDEDFFAEADLDFPIPDADVNSSTIHAVSSSSSTGNNWDKILDDYEKLVDKYIALLKKSSSGDMNALTELASYMQKAQDLYEKLENADDEMTIEQMNRMVKINSKMAESAASMAQ